VGTILIHFVLLLRKVWRMSLAFEEKVGPNVHVAVNGTLPTNLLIVEGNFKSMSQINMLQYLLF
jgi:hypothetical protein